MIGRFLAGVWSTVRSMTRSHRHFLVNFLLPIGLMLLTVSALAGWSSERDARASNDTLLQYELRLARRNAERWEILYDGVKGRQARDDVAVTVTRERWRTLRDTIWQELADANRVHSETPALLKDLPVFIRATDSTVAACAEYQVSCEERGRIADSLLAAKDRQLALLEHAAVWKPPRWTAEAEVLYDPLAVVPMGSGAVTFRVARGVSLVARGAQRFAPGERPRGYVGIRLTR